MTRFTLSKDYNQEFSTSYGEYQFLLKFTSFRNLWYCTITRTDGEEDVVLAANVRCVNGEWLIPWSRHAELGNFRFEDLEGEYLHPSLNKDLILVYYTPNEFSSLTDE